MSLFGWHLPDGLHGPMDGLAAAIDDQTALVALTQTAFKSGYTYDLAAVTAVGAQIGGVGVVGFKPYGWGGSC